MNSENLYNKAKELEEADELLEANQLYKRAFELDPEKNALLAKIAFNYMIAGKSEEYIEYALKYLNEVPDSEKMMDSEDTLWSLYHHLGVAFGKLGRSEKALKYFKEAIAIKNEPQSIMYAGKACMALGHEKEAISFWKTAAKMGNGKAILALNTRGIEI